MKEYKIVDISHHNGVINWCDLVNEGIKGVIIKCGGSETTDGHTYQDILFEDYYLQAKNHNLLVGCYYFGVGNSTEKGLEDALRCRELIKDKQFELPVFLDYECSKNTGSTNTKNNKQGNTNYCISFMHTLEKFKYFTGIYGSDISTFKDLVNKNELLHFAWWVARYGTSVQYAIENCQIWQYTSNGRIGSNSCNFDINKSTVDYSFIKKKGFNGYD